MLSAKYKGKIMRIFWNYFADKAKLFAYKSQKKLTIYIYSR